VLTALCLAAGSLCAGAAGLRAQEVVVVTTDRGGLIADRVADIRAIRQNGGRVELRGPLCLSTCTMYLGAGDVCVNPRATFGFHGPSSYGRRLPEAEFAYWSVVMADHYPQPLRDWFLSTARYRISGYYRLSGRDLQRLGFPAC